MSLFTAATIAAGRLLPGSEEIPFDDKGYTTANSILPPWKELIPGSLASIIVFSLLYWKAGPIIKKSMKDRTARIQKELDDAKRELAGSFPLSTASNADIVGQLGAMGFYNLPLSYLEDFMKQSQALTVEQVKAALNKHLSADKMIIVTAGPTIAQKPLPPPTDKPAEQPLGVPEH